MSLRKELILSKLRKLKDSLNYIKEFLPSEQRLLTERKDKNALYKEAEFAIQLIVDTCSIINSDIGRVTPSDEDSIIDLVVKKKVISERLGKKIKEMKGFRNILVHRYGDIDDKVAYESISSGLKDIEDFVGKIESFLKKYKNESRRNKH